MSSELDLKILARLQAHELLIQQLLRLAFDQNVEALRDFAGRQNACLDMSRLPAFDPAMSARLPYEVQQAVAKIHEAAVRDAEGKQMSEQSSSS